MMPANDVEKHCHFLEIKYRTTILNTKTHVAYCSEFAVVGYNGFSSTFTADSSLDITKNGGMAKNVEVVFLLASNKTVDKNGYFCCSHYNAHSLWHGQLGTHVATPPPPLHTHIAPMQHPPYANNIPPPLFFKQ